MLDLETLFRSLRPDFIETWPPLPWTRIVRPIVPVFKTGLLCDSTSPSGLRIRGSNAPVFSVVYVLRLGCSGG